MTSYRCALCGRSTTEAAMIDGVPFCYAARSRTSCYAEAQVRREVQRLHARVAASTTEENP